MNDTPNQLQTQDEASVAGSLRGVETPQLLPFAQLGLRLLGVMMVVDGVGAICGGWTQGILQARAYSEAGYPVPIDPHSAGWVAAGVVQLISGLYLIADGNWVLNNVFAPARHQSDTES